MSALARYFNSKGEQVFGYDKTATTLTNTLEDEGMQITFNDEVESLPPEILENIEETLVVYTPAIPKDSVLLNFFMDKNYHLFKRSKVLGMVTEDSLNLSIAGTHGKTTTSCMLASIFKASDLRFYAFLGGISADLGSNFYHQTGDGSLFTITEADEYDRSFLNLHPTYAAITSTDSDHLDIYGDANSVEQSFREFASLIIDNSCLIAAKGKTTGIDCDSYSSVDSQANYVANITQSTSKGSSFEIVYEGQVLLDQIYLNIPGLHNVENAMAAALLSLKAGVGKKAIRAGLAEFKGIKRRFEYIIDKEDLVYVDDYAHHPSELDAIIHSVRELYPSKKITGVFQPHLYSRTRDFADGFATSLSQLDEVILIPIYPARELPIEGVSSEMIAEKVTVPCKVVAKEQLVDLLDLKTTEVLLTLGAGDIDQLVEKIKQKYHG